MGLLTERVETESEVIVVFKRLWIPYYVFFLSIAMMVASSSLEFMQHVTFRYVSWAFAVLGLVGMFYASRLFSGLLTRGWIQVSGHKLSISNPLTIRLKKDVPQQQAAEQARTQ
jgi:hypothetical protein